MANTKTLTEILNETKIAELEASINCVVNADADIEDRYITELFGRLHLCVENKIGLPKSADLFVDLLVGRGKYDLALYLMDAEKAKTVFGNLIDKYMNVQDYDKVREITEVLGREGIQEVYTPAKSFLDPESV